MTTKKDAATAFALAILFPAVLAVGLLIFAAVTQTPIEEINIWLQLALAQIGILAAGIFVVWRKKIVPKKFAGLDRAPKSTNIFLLFALALSMVFVMNPVQNAVLWLLEKMGYVSSLTSLDFDALNFWQWAGAIFLAAIMPAFAEEIVFRGLVLEGYRKKRMDWTAILVSAVLFAIMHKTIEQFVHPLVMGIVFGVVYCATGSLWSTIILHFFNNIIVIVFSSVSALNAFAGANWWLIFPAVFVAAASMYFILKSSKQTEFVFEEEKKSKQPFEQILLLPAVGYCIAVLIFGLV